MDALQLGFDAAWSIIIGKPKQTGGIYLPCAGRAIDYNDRPALAGHDVMKATIGFLFFMLFLAGLLLVNLRNVQNRESSGAFTLADIAAVAWRPTHLGEMPLADNTRMQLQFDAEGGLSGHGGCNRFSGNYELGNETLKIGPLAATRMACPEPVGSFEFSFFDALQSANGVEMNGDRLTILNANGDAVVRFISAARQPVAQ